MDTASDFQNLNPYLSAHKAYTDFDFNADESSHKFLIDKTKEIKNQIAIHPNIHYKFRPTLKDVRPFILNDFVVIKRYTYQVKLDELSIANVESIPEFSKFSMFPYKLTNGDFNKSDLDLHLSFLKSKISNRRLRTIKKDLLKNIDCLSTLNIVDERGNLCSQMVYNKFSKNAEQLFYWDSDSFKRERAGIFAQYTFMLFLKEQGYTIFDFCGANMKNIAQYKSRFPVELLSFYEAWYHRNSIKRLLRKYLFHQI